MDIQGPGIVGSCMSMEYGGGSSRRESPCVKLNAKICCCVAFIRMVRMSGILRGARADGQFPGQGERAQRRTAQK